MIVTPSAQAVNSSSVVTFTATPNWLFDEVGPDLSAAPLKTLLYITRHTCGYHKMADAISLDQFHKGIRTNDGRQLDRGCGIKNRTAILKGLAELTERGIIGQIKSHRDDGRDATTVYYLAYGSTGEQGGGTVTAPTGVHLPHPQKKPVPKQKSLDLETPKPPAAVDQDRESLAASLARVGQQLGTVFTASHVSRALTMMRAAGLQLAVFCLMLVEALRITTERQRKAPIETPAAYYFTVLAGVIAQEQQRTAMREPLRAPESPGQPPQDPEDLWGRISQEIAAIVTPENYARWIAPTRQLAHEGEQLTIAVASDFDYQWLDRRLRGLIERCARLVQPGLAIRFEVHGPMSYQGREGSAQP